MIRYAVVILFIASLLSLKMQARRRGLVSTKSSRTPVAQIAMSVRTTCRYGLDQLWGQTRPHGMNINAGVSPSAPNTCPAAPVIPSERAIAAWRLALRNGRWRRSRCNGSAVEADICSQIKDPARNGNRTIAEIVEHIEHEPLVHWGWAPGPGREPAPYSVAQLVEFLKQWDAAGAPCPTK